MADTTVNDLLSDLDPRFRPNFMAETTPCADMMVDGLWLDRLRSRLVAVAQGLAEADRAGG